VGDAHATAVARSSEQLKLEPLSVEANANAAFCEETLPDGPLTIDVSGGVVSEETARFTRYAPRPCVKA